MRYDCLRLLLLCLSAVTISRAQVPAMINYQGRIVVDGSNFTGNGQFKFAFVNGSGSTTFWSHDGTSAGGSAPVRHVVLPVSAGLYSVALGDTSVLNSVGAPMQPITPADLGTSDLWLRIWFNDGATGFQQLSPDQRITAVAYSLVADTVSDGAITTAKLAPGSVTVDKLAAQVGGNMQASLSPSDSSLLSQGYIKVNTISAPSWQSPGTEGPSGRTEHGAVWTGSTMIVWGGKVGAALSHQGGSYFPGTEEWSLLSSNEVSPARSLHRVVWANDRMIVWGGFTSAGESQTGAIYAPSDPTANPPVGGWLATSVTSAPAARSGHSAVWTGSEMLVWGGKNSGGVLRNGGVYTPPAGPLIPGAEGSWSPLSTTTSPAASHGHSAVWADTLMVTWGGLNASFQPLRSGGIYNPTANSWASVPTAGAPSARTGHSAVWTGTHMVVFGGSKTEIPSTANDLLSDGAAFDPLSRTWSPLSMTGAPSARHRHQSLWTGSEVLILGGETVSGQTALTGAAYNPSTDTWRDLPSTTEYSAGQTAVWSGSEVLVFGENGLISLDPAPAVYLYARF